MGHTEKNSYIMLFCALLLVKKSRMKLQDVVRLYPFTGEAHALAQQLAGVAPTETAADGIRC